MVVPAERRRRSATPQRAQPGPRARHGLGRPRAHRVQLPADARSRRRSGSPSSSAPTSCSRRAPRPPRSTRAAWASRARRRPARATRTGSCCRARTATASAAAGSSTRCACPRGPTATRSSPSSTSAGSRPRPTCRASTCSRRIASASATSRACSRSPRTRPSGCSRCPFFPGHHRGADRALLRGARGGASGKLDVTMARLPDPQDELFARLNSSISFDRRLWPQDIAGSKAHVEALRGAGVLNDDEAATLTEGLDERRSRARGWRVRVRPGRRGHPHGGRTPADRAGRRGRRQAPHRPLPQRPGRDRPGALRARALGGRGRAERGADGAAARRWPRPTRTGRCPGYTHLQRAQPVYLAHHLLAYFWMLRRDAARFAAARAGAGEMPLGAGALAGTRLRARPRRDGRAARLRPARRRTRSTPWPAAISRWPTWQQPRSAPPTSRGSAPSWCSGRARSSASASPPTTSPRARA